MLADVIKALKRAGALSPPPKVGGEHSEFVRGLSFALVIVEHYADPMTSPYYEAMSKTQIDEALAAVFSDGTLALKGFDPQPLDNPPPSPAPRPSWVCASCSKTKTQRERYKSDRGDVCARCAHERMKP